MGGLLVGEKANKPPRSLCFVKSSLKLSGQSFLGGFALSAEKACPDLYESAIESAQDQTEAMMAKQQVTV